MKELPASFVARCPSFAQDTNARLVRKIEESNYSTPLIFAAAAGYTEVVRVLCEHPDRENNIDWENESGGAKMERMTKTQVNIIHDATEVEQPEGPLRLLVQHGVSVDKRINYYRDWYGDTPLSAAAKRGGAATVEALLRLGADLRLSEELDHTPLFDAIRNDNVDLVSLLLDNGGIMMPRGREEWPPLECAAYYGSMEVANMLLDRGADINAPETGKLLLKYKADVNTMDKGKASRRFKSKPISALAWAVWLGREEIARLLIDHGADVNTMGWGRQVMPLLTATILYSEKRHLYTKMLLDNGADANALDDWEFAIVLSTRERIYRSREVVAGTWSGRETTGLAW
ncbi:ankyrin repeat domain-containing protein [Aspergillus affinis]|uniref:ankyrin repeat domain-containing protein n=1 Tax=Aspergillus affinis TaxID=1070780 RepID=UPI0022FEF656|nr:ankyrin repeat domain-containing protein [Aspergillus affinis]KAI9044744.1 serine/threonine-protein phosphatase 6 regulatory ankyrin repeat subunit B-like [Aspergillus affinis]